MFQSLLIVDLSCVNANILTADANMHILVHRVNANIQTADADLLDGSAEAKHCSIQLSNDLTRFLVLQGWQKKACHK
jgi:hypothetical protein